MLAWGYGKAFGNKTRHVPTPQKITPKHIENSVVISLAAGDCHSMVLYDSGVLFSWGNNYEVRWLVFVLKCGVLILSTQKHRIGLSTRW